MDGEINHHEYLGSLHVHQQQAPLVGHTAIISSAKVSPLVPGSFARIPSRQARVGTIVSITIYANQR